MNPTEIDDALRTDRQVEPTAQFRAQVMRAVHARAATGPPRDRVARAIWPAVVVASAAVALLIAVPILERSEAQPGELNDVVRWLAFSVTGTIAIASRHTRWIV